ncbi:hypothetical protein [Paracoccus sulfuroxidans]|uniref:Uncharacterized protein n=1 Tax=Paracoccus sulfuroxidans TaxID=384678 RepID=A0A562NBC8_9RHOB|nr:hypothetical protein [Paracoccus sulfuroxidans]TWI29456.1 hypothetical protein IQ24_03666 [Paracoccus sulfuroxidans]
MRNDLNASEKRLFAALERIDAYLDRRAQGTDAAATDTEGSAPGTESEAREDARRLAHRLAVTEQRHASAMAELETRLEEAQRQLTEAGRQAVAMSAANETLAKANRKLLDAGGSISGDDASAALQAEIDALRAARGAEISQMGEIVDALDRMLDTPPLDTGRNTAKAARAAKADPDAVVEDDQGAEVAEGERG